MVLLIGPFVAIVGIVAIVFVMRHKSVEKRSMYSARRQQIEHKVRAARQRTLAPRAHAPKAPEQAAQPEVSGFAQPQAQPTLNYDVAAYQQAPPFAPPGMEAPAQAPAPPGWNTGPMAPPEPPGAPAWESGAAAGPAPAPPEAPGAPAWESGAAAASAPAPPAWETGAAPGSSPWETGAAAPPPPPPGLDYPPAVEAPPSEASFAPAAEPAPLPATGEPAWTPAPMPSEPAPSPEQVQPAAAAVGAPGDAGWSIVSPDKAEAEAPAAGKGRAGSAWSLASGETPGAESEEAHAKKPSSTVVAIAQYAVLVVGLVMVLIGVLVMVANSHGA